MSIPKAMFPKAMFPKAMFTKAMFTKALFPKARFARIPDAGHWLHAEVPEAFQRAVNAFLERRSS